MSIIEVLKYEGDNRTFVWKHPCEDFNTSTQLIVHESQEAIFFYNGKALDSFGPGKHTLITQNIPLLTSASSKIMSGGERMFHAEVYFVNLVEQLGIPWGTNSKIHYLDPQFNFPLSIGASGEMALSVANPRKLLIKLVGTEALLSQGALVAYLKSFLQTRVKSTIANAIVDGNINIFELDARLETLSTSVKQKLASDFIDYGISLTQFFITNVVKPEGDSIYEDFKTLYFRQYADIKDAEIKQQTALINAETQARQKVIDAKAQAEKRRVEGYTYQQERGLDVAEKAAQNEAAGEFGSMGIGLGMMAGVGMPIGSAVGSTVTDALKSFQTQSPQMSVRPQEPCGLRAKFCSQCGYAFADESMNFCPQCGKNRD